MFTRSRALCTHWKQREQIFHLFCFSFFISNIAMLRVNESFYTHLMCLNTHKCTSMKWKLCVRTAICVCSLVSLWRWTKEAKRSETFFNVYLIKNYTCYRIAFWSSFTWSICTSFHFVSVMLVFIFCCFIFVLCLVCLFFSIRLFACAMHIHSKDRMAHSECKKCGQKWCFIFTLCTVVCIRVFHFTRSKKKHSRLAINN